MNARSAARTGYFATSIPGRCPSGQPIGCPDSLLANLVFGRAKKVTKETRPGRSPRYSGGPLRCAGCTSAAKAMDGRERPLLATPGASAAQDVRMPRIARMRGERPQLAKQNRLGSDTRSLNFSRPGCGARRAPTGGTSKKHLRSGCRLGGVHCPICALSEWTETHLLEVLTAF